MLKYGIYMVLGGGVLAVMALNEAKQSSAGQDEPQEITCAELVDEGYGNNAHVRMTEFHLCEHEYVYEEKIQWTKAWVPAVPLGSSIHRTLAGQTDGGSAAPTLRGEQIKLIVLLPEARSERDVEEAAKREAIQGLMIRPLQMFDREQERLLEESYPGLNFEDCMLLVEGRRPASRTKTVTLTGIGLGLVVVGGFLSVSAIRKRRRA